MQTTLNDAERALVVDHLSRTRDDLLAVIEPLSAEDWTRKDGPDRWSPAECCEHILLVENAVFGRVLHTPEADTVPDLTGQDQKILQMVPARNGRMEAPPFAVPTNRFPAAADFLEEFGQKRSEVIAYARATADPVHARVAPHSVLGPCSGYHWLLFIGAHCERHANQIKESLRSHSAKA
jgi:hypothetical protein